MSKTSTQKGNDVSTIDVSSLTAFDVHTHVHRSVRGGQQPDPGGREDMGEYFRIGTMPRYTVPELADYYRQRNMACVTFTVDSISQTGDEPVPDNFEVAELAAEHADVLIPFASIDPARGAAGVAQARRLIADFGVRGFKFHPGTQAFYPNDRMAYPLYEVIAEHGLVALFHTGQTGVGAGTRGGGGIRLKYSNPLYLDDVAADFPDMDIIMAHPSFPWQDEALSIATHKPRVYIDLSGWSPKYFSPLLVQYAGSLLRHKVLFGTDFPVMTPERWIQDFENLSIKPEVRPLIMKENAARLFGLSGVSGSEPAEEGVSSSTISGSGPARSSGAAGDVGEVLRACAAVDDEVGAGDQPGVVRAQPRDRVADVGRGPGRPHRDHRRPRPGPPTRPPPGLVASRPAEPAAPAVRQHPARARQALARSASSSGLSGFGAVGVKLLIRMPYGARSMAAARTKLFTPPLWNAYAITPEVPDQPLDEEMQTIEPLMPRSAIARPTCLVLRK